MASGPGEGSSRHASAHYRRRVAKGQLGSRIRVRPDDRRARAIGVGEAFYDSCGRRAQFQVGPTAPPDLDEALASRGYAREAPVWVQATALEDLLERARAAPTDVQANVPSVPDAAWIEIEIARGRYAEIAATFLDALSQLGPRAGFATARVGGAAAASCLFVHDQDIVVLSAMRTLPETRRRGAARALLHAGALWAAERGAARMMLQVDCDNTPALSLYASEGFATQYAYHYRAR